MKRPKPTYTRTKFCMRWRGRRWYDPNEWKLVWSAASAAGVTLAIRAAVFLLAGGQPAPLAARTPPPVGIMGTAHDLSASGMNHVTGSSEVCIFCHTPHRAPEGIRQNIPEWNHVTTSVTFVMYTSPGIKGAIDTQPVGPSLACLSCHDGTVAMGALHELPEGGGQDDYASAQGGVNRASGLMVGPNLVGRDLSNVHPISIAYRDDLNKTLRPPGELVGVKLYPSNVRGAKVQCSSCHDPHNFGTDGSTAPFLRVTKHGSSLCLACHKV
ncbi:MAG TPA: cytochrome c3 family protein [Holophagaceae bacterium]|nr:cytochrome c3 family protein [Holophagaceae bacterium]